MKRITTTKTTVEEYDENQKLVRREITEETVEENDSSHTPYMPYVPSSPYTPWISKTYGGDLRKYDPTTYTINLTNPPTEDAVSSVGRMAAEAAAKRD